MTYPLLDLLQRVRVNEVLFQAFGVQGVFTCWAAKLCLIFSYCFFTDCAGVRSWIGFDVSTLYNVECSTMVLIQQYGCCVLSFGAMLFNSRKRVFFLKINRGQQTPKALKLAPVWPGQPWFPLLLSMLVTEPILIPQKRTSLLNHMQKPHPLIQNKTVQLAAFQCNFGSRGSLDLLKKSRTGRIYLTRIWHWKQLC